MTYKHRDIVIAYMDGKKIQEFDTTTSIWRDLDIFEGDIPYFFNNKEQYRIKPVKKKYRVAKLGDFTTTADSLDSANEFMKSSIFTCWLTDWVEYE